jgi:hypothetical protein
MSYDLVTDARSKAAIWAEMWRPLRPPVPLAGNISGVRGAASLGVPTEQTVGAGSPPAGSTPVTGSGTPGAGGAPAGGTISGRPVLAHRVAAVHVTGETVGGTALHETRVIGPIANPFVLRTLVVVAVTPPAPGQFIDVLVASDTDVSDVTSPTGTSILRGAVPDANHPATDDTPGLPLISGTYDLPGVLETDTGGLALKIHVYAIAPAIALPDAHVLVIYDELGALPVTTIPTIPTQLPAPTPTPAPAPTPTPTPAPAIPRHYTAHLDNTVPGVTTCVLDASDDPDLPVGFRFLWSPTMVPASFTAAMIGGRVTWGPTVYATPAPVQPYPWLG